MRCWIENDKKQAREIIPPGKPARVVFYDPRRGCGAAVLIDDGRRVRIPLQAMHDARLITLDSGDVIYVELDDIDPRRVETLHHRDERGGDDGVGATFR